MMGENMSFHSLRELMNRTVGGSGIFPDSDGRLVEKKFIYCEPATDKSFHALLSRGISMPEEFHRLLRISDGFEIYNFQGVDGYKVFGTSELLGINKLVGDSYGDEWDDRFLVFAECIGDGTYLAVKRLPNGNEVVDCFLEVDPSEWKIISPGVTEFFAQLIKSNGQKFWLKESKGTAS